MSTDPAVSPGSPASSVEATLVRVLRAAIEHLCRRMPDVDPALRKALLRRYRDAEGERAGTPFSRAKSDLIEHLAAFRSQYPRVLAACLQSQFHRLAGRPTPWPDPDGDPDAPQPERRTLIAGLCRHVPLDGPEGLIEFDRRLSLLIGRAPAGVRANPVRPAVFFHALGLCWSRIAGTDRDELDVIQGYGRQLLPAVGSVYPLLLAMLPATQLALERPVPPQRALPVAGSVAQPAAASLPAPSHAAAATADGEPPAVSAIVLVSVDLVQQMFEPVLANAGLPADVRLHVARLQLAALRAGLVDARVFSDLRHPARTLLDGVGRTEAWRGAGAGARLARLAAAADAAQGGEDRFERLLAMWDGPADAGTANAVEVEVEVLEREAATA